MGKIDQIKKSEILWNEQLIIIQIVVYNYGYL